MHSMPYVLSPLCYCHCCLAGGHLSVCSHRIILKWSENRWGNPFKKKVQNGMEVVYESPIISAPIESNHFNKFISGVLFLCHKSCPRIGVTNSPLSLNVYNPPDEKENMKWGKQRGEDTRREWGQHCLGHSSLLCDWQPSMGPSSPLCDWQPSMGPSSHSVIGNLEEPGPTSLQTHGWEGENQSPICSTCRL